MVTENTAGDSSKLSLDFLLNESTPSPPKSNLSLVMKTLDKSENDMIKEEREMTSRKRKTSKRAMTAEEKRRARSCKVETCTNYAIDSGLCFNHGGGKICSIEGCHRSAKRLGLCWKHGGSTACSVEGCSRGAKSQGLCWTHGGGKECSVPDCKKSAVSNGCCWAHGGGRRCGYRGCTRKPSKGTHSFCKQHYEEIKDNPDAVVGV